MHLWASSKDSAAICSIQTAPLIMHGAVSLCTLPTSTPLSQLPAGPGHPIFMHRYVLRQPCSQLHSVLARCDAGAAPPACEAVGFRAWQRSRSHFPGQVQDMLKLAASLPLKVQSKADQNGLHAHTSEQTGYLVQEHEAWLQLNGWV